MNKSFTLVIPTHKRHAYLKRALDYYNDVNFKIIVADSTDQPYIPANGEIKQNVQYFHLPGTTLTQKLEHTFSLVGSEFVAMCADDDFILINSLSKCIDFLVTNPDYAVANGNSICYHKSSLSTNTKFAVVYDRPLNFNIADNDPIARLKKFFSSYNEIFYAVHRTENFKIAFKGAGSVVKQVYLNEYLTGIIPLIKGKVIFLPLLYQVREYIENSGDRMAPNLDAIFSDKNYKKEFVDFVDLQSGKVEEILKINHIQSNEALSDILLNFAKSLIDNKSNKVKSASDKTLGNIIKNVPFFGPLIINLFRNIKRRHQLNDFLNTNKYRRELKKIKNILLKYR